MEQKTDPASGTPLWDYEFSVWPHHNAEQALFELFRAMPGRVIMTLTEAAFSNFHEALARNGLTLREVERRPAFDPEPVL